jgi:pimeloyl-ACP methyl ester carboxylesterase
MTVQAFKHAKGRGLIFKSYDQLLALWGTQVEEIDLPTKYGVTHCIQAGSKENPPLLLFHGVGDNSAVMWILNIQELSKHFYCIAIDTLGGPGKSVPNESYRKNSFDQADWINEVVELLGMNDFNLAGVSNGAYMAYNYATREPHKVNKVICLEGGMLAKPFKSMIQTLLLMFPEILVPSTRNLLRILKKLSSPQSDLFDKHPEIANHLIMLMKTHNQQAMFVHKLNKYDKEKAAAVRDKLYFLIGDHRLESKKDFIKILENDDFRYKIFTDTGHGINHEQPDLINHEIIEFLKRG